MPTPISSPALRSVRPRAPEPSPALVALQEQGLELPIHSAPSVSPQSTTANESNLRFSPLSTLSTSSNFDKSLPLELGDRNRWRQRPSSAGSAETSVTKILNLYANLSEQSLRSEYEEITPCPDDSDEDTDAPPIPLVHQPKAYRDTIAPLLEHQFSTDNLTVPPAPSPVSFVSTPRLHHPNVSMSVPSLDLTLQSSPNGQAVCGKKARLSETSIQITPEMTPPFPLLDMAPAPTFQEYSQNLRERKVALEVPDVRDAESWYDHPLSPVSPEEAEVRLQDSRMSAVSPEGAIDYQRHLAYETLVPPPAKTSPSMRPISYVQDCHAPESVAATLSNVLDDKMVPPPLDLTMKRAESVNKISQGSAPVHQTEVSDTNTASGVPKSQHASLVTQYPIEGSMTICTAPSPVDRLSQTKVKEQGPDLKEIHRPGSTFSNSSDATRHDTLSHLKAAFKFGKKKDKSSKDSLSKPKQIKSSSYGTTSSANFQEDLESYKYTYWKSHDSVPQTIALQHRLHSPGLESMHSTVSHSDDLRRASAISGPGPSIDGSPQRVTQQLQEQAYARLVSPPTPGCEPANFGEPPTVTDNVSSKSIGAPSPQPPVRRREPQAAIPLTEYQKHGPKIWSEKTRKRELKEAGKAAKQAAKEARAAEKARKKHANAGSINVPNARLEESWNSYGADAAGLDTAAFYYSSANHSRPPSSRAYASNRVDTTSVETKVSLTSTDAAFIKSSRQSSVTPGFTTYNNEIFEASGGKKRSKFASRLMMSSEEKRKQKVKESITVVGVGRLGVAASGKGERAGKDIIG